MILSNGHNMASKKVLKAEEMQFGENTAEEAERYFEVIEVDPREQLRAAVLCMEGQALSWFRWSEAREPFRSCEELKKDCEDVEALENVVEDEPHFFTKIVDNDLCAGKGGRGGSMVGSGGGWLAKHSIVSNEGCGGAVLAVLGGKSSNGACGGEVNSRGVILGVFKSLLGEILGDVIGERGGYTIRVDGGTI
ncbi:hypothetical protein Tco_0863238, partial [Tanacetum coccineum]